MCIRTMEIRNATLSTIHCFPIRYNVAWLSTDAAEGTPK